MVGNPAAARPTIQGKNAFAHAKLCCMEHGWLARLTTRSWGISSTLLPGITRPPHVMVRAY